MNRSSHGPCRRRALAASLALFVLAVGARGAQDDSAAALFLRAQELLETRRPAALAESATLFERVVELDGDHALAQSGLAVSSCLLALYSVEPPGDTLERARRAAEAAVALDPARAEPYASLGLVAFLYDWDFPRAERLFLASLERDPEYASASHWYAMLLSSQQRFDEAVEQIDRASRSDRDSRIITVKRGTVLMTAGLYESAERQLLEASKRFPSMALPFRELGFLRLRQNRPAEAVTYFERAAALAGGASKSTGGLGLAYARVGRVEDARAVLADLEERSRSAFVPPIYLALMHVGLGEHKAALDRLEQALELHDPGLVYMAIKPAFDVLSGEPRYEALLATVGIGGHAR